MNSLKKTVSKWLQTLIISLDFVGMAFVGMARGPCVWTRHFPLGTPQYFIVGFLGPRGIWG